MTNVTAIRRPIPKCNGCGIPLTRLYASETDTKRCRECVAYDAYRAAHEAFARGTDPDEAGRLPEGGR